MRWPSLRGSLLAAASMAAVWAPPSSARAQAAVDRARDAFERGLAAETEGRVADACTAFRESLALVRELGPLRKVAACDEREGRLSAAAQALTEVLKSLPPDDPERAATEEILARVRAGMARLVLVRRSDAAAGISARVEGRILDVPSSEVLLDPGTHDIVVEVPGSAVRVVRIAVGSGETSRLELPPAEDDVRVLPPPPTAAVALPPTARPPSTALRTTGLVVGGIGLTGLLGAGITGIKLLGDQATFDRCDADPRCDSAALADSADSLVVINAIAWGVGALGVGVGATLLVVDATSDEGATVRGEVGLGRASLSGRF